MVAVPNQRCALFDDSARRSGGSDLHMKSAKALTSTPVAVRLGVHRGPLSHFPTTDREVSSTGSTGTRGSLRRCTCSWAPRSCCPLLAPFNRASG